MQLIREIFRFSHMKNILIIALILSNISFAQDLINNGDFEDYSICPDNVSQLSRADYWTSYGTTPDYYNSCSEAFEADVPYNLAGFQNPASGEGYAAFSPMLAR
jgi:hypothetical protein